MKKYIVTGILILSTYTFGCGVPMESSANSDKIKKINRKVALLEKEIKDMSKKYPKLYTVINTEKPNKKQIEAALKELKSIENKIKKKKVKA